MFSHFLLTRSHGTYPRKKNKGDRKDTCHHKGSGKPVAAIWSETAQEELVGHNRNGTECHGEPCKFRSKDDPKADENTRSNRNTDHIVEEREK